MALVQAEQRTEGTLSTLAVYVVAGLAALGVACATVLAAVGVLPVADWLAFATTTGQAAVAAVGGVAAVYTGARTAKKAIETRAEARVQVAHAEAGASPNPGEP